MDIFSKLKNLNSNFKEIEEKDLQFIYLKNLYFNIKNKDFYLSLILANSIICYQLSSTGERYWEEFCNYFIINEINNIDELIEKLSIFIKASKGNKRFVETKINRLNKLKPFLDTFIKNQEKYYENMFLLNNDLAKVMKQKNTQKTIVFGVKMFGYGARIYFDKFIEFPKEISIPIDSRLTKIYEIYNNDKNLTINDFYKNISYKLDIPLLHLDAIIWVNYEKLL
ncbi:N-glycosylase/DNA lyase [Candidatus Gracilibacteria bacterium]|nr:N-glycosylase/DNA lyase [Candidatus Gracilibacteria bacterium]